MSEGIRRLMNDPKGKSNRRTVPSKRSTWVARWMQTNSNAVVETSNRGADELRCVSRDHSLTNRLEAPVPIRWGVFMNKPLEIASEGLKGSSKDDDVQALGNVSGRDQLRGKAVENKSEIRFPSISGVPVAVGTSSRRCRLFGEGTSKNPLAWMETQTTKKDSDLVVSKPLPETLVESSSCVVPYGFNYEKGEPDRGKISLSYLIGRSSSFPDNNLKTPEHESCHKGSQSADLVVGRNSRLDVFNAPSTSDLQQFGHEWFHKNEVDIFRSTRDVTKFNENKSRGHHSQWPFSSQGDRGVMLKSLSNSTDGEGKSNVGDRKASKATPENESSAETKTLDMDLLKEKNSRSGTNSTASTKAMDMGSKMPPQVDATSSREAGSRNMGLPDINVEPPPSPAEANISENICLSSTRTETLDIDTPFTHVVQSKPVVDLNRNDTTKEDPSSRWVKRLKCSSPMSPPQGTKTSNLVEMSHDKISKLYATTLKNRISNAQPTPSERQDKESMPLDKNDDGTLADQMENDEELLLSHSWIQRWLCNESRIALKKPETAVVSQPQSSKLALDDLPKKQFPSIAAMALLGKAMNGFQQCELQKRGSFTVWNTKSFC